MMNIQNLMTGQHKNRHFANCPIMQKHEVVHVMITESDEHLSDGLLDDILEIGDFEFPFQESLSPEVKKLLEKF